MPDTDYRHGMLEIRQNCYVTLASTAPACLCNSSNVVEIHSGLLALTRITQISVAHQKTVGLRG